MKKTKKAQKINVRILKSPGPEKAPAKKADKKEKDTYKHSFEDKEAEKKKKIVIGASITIIMLIIFITWISLLGQNLSRVEDGNENFWQRLIGNLRNNFEDIQNKYEGAKESLKNIDPEGVPEETEVEKSIFPETK